MTDASKRRHYFEFCDQAWLPHLIREGFHDGLEFLHSFYKPYKHLYKFVGAWAMQNEILDVASGNGAHIAELLRELKKERATSPTFVLSDLFPLTTSFKELQNAFGSAIIKYKNQPFPIANLKTARENYCTIFSSFHHLNWKSAESLVRDALENNKSLCIVEPTVRNLFYIPMMLPGLPLQMVRPLFSRRFSISKVIFSTIIPVIPLMIIHDAMVSVLRSYTKEEIVSMIPNEFKGKVTIDYKEEYWSFLPIKSYALFIVSNQKGS